MEFNETDGITPADILKCILGNPVGGRHGSVPANTLFFCFISGDDQKTGRVLFQNVIFKCDCPLIHLCLNDLRIFYGFKILYNPQFVQFIHDYCIRGYYICSDGLSV